MGDAREVGAPGARGPGFLCFRPISDLVLGQERLQQQCFLRRRGRNCAGQPLVPAGAASLAILVSRLEMLLREIGDQLCVGPTVELEAARLHPDRRGDRPHLDLVGAPLHLEARQNCLGQSPRYDRVDRRILDLFPAKLGAFQSEVCSALSSLRPK